MVFKGLVWLDAGEGMASVRTLANPPIIEGVLGISVASEIEPKDIEIVAKELAASYPVIHALVEIEGQIQIGPGSNMVGHQQRLKGFQIRSESENVVASLKSDGINVSVLAPYQGFEALVEIASNVWGAYTRSWPALQVTQVGLRYINQLDLPLPIPDFQDYIRTVPLVGSPLPQGLSQFAMQLVLPEPGTGNVAIINELLDPQRRKSANSVPIIFDIEVRRECNLGSDVWTTIRDLRRFKNEVFFGSLTERCLELFQ